MVWWAFAAAHLCVSQPLAQPTRASPAATAALDRLQYTLSNGWSLDPLIDATLDVCRAIPGEQGLDVLPASAAELREAAAFFNWADGSTLGQHLFDVALWDDALETMARAVAEDDSNLAVEAASAVAASAAFLHATPAQQRDAIDALSTAILSPPLLDSRRAALAIAKQQRRLEKPPTVEAAFHAARMRRVQQDFVAVAPGTEDDARIIIALYDSIVRALGASVLTPLGFPSTKLGLRSLVASDRATGGQRAAAALGRVWHAADELAPLIVRPAGVTPAAAASKTLVVVFSSLGWHGLVRAEWYSTLRAVGDESLVVAHAMDTAQSWFTTSPASGEFDDGAWWDDALAELCAPYARVCLLGESMGASGAMRFARHATESVVALVPQIDVRDFDYSARADFDDARKQRLVESIQHACATTSARMVLHVGQDPPDLRQLAYLPSDLAPERLEVVRHNVAGHALGAGLKAAGLLRKTVLRDLLGHTSRLPAAGETCAAHV